VEPHGSPHWLRDGSFLWFSERTGWKHLYRVNVDGAVQPVTRGEWEARTLLAVDEPRGLLYFAGTERSVTGGDVYRVRLDGSEQRRLTERRGTHTAVFNPAASLFLDTWSDVRTPPEVRLHDAEGREVRKVHAGPPPALAEYRMGTVEFVQVRARDGFAMEAMLIKPAGFDGSRRYPVLQSTYAGPHAQRVKDAWCDSCLFQHLVAERGVVVFVLDNRTASGKGAVSAWPAYRQLGVTEMADIEDGVAWLKRQPWVDGSRIGIEGWSYGGFMASYALTHSRSFRMGIAGAPVTDWRLYDSVYTERFMDTPARNAEGYQRTSVREAAAALHGDLLLVHGLADDNVHPQNTHQLAFALQQAGRPFRLLTYARQRHAFRDRRLIHHLRTAMMEFIEETLLRAE
jgi:dipeptidyl-peptidase-4